MFVNYDLTLDAESLDVFIFKKLVYKALGLATDDKYKKRSARFDKDLYDKALSLPEAKTVTLDYLNDASFHKYGKFKGGNTYKDFNGTLDKSNAKSIEGWVFVDNTDGQYAVIQNNSNRYIINIRDFTPTPIVADFTPLYDKLRYVDVGDEDIKLIASLEATYSDDASKYIQDKDEEFDPTQKADWEKFVEDLNKRDVVNKPAPANIENAFTYPIPVQIGAKQQDKIVSNSSVMNDIQAIMYDMPNGNTDINQSITRLYSYQQPDNISYTAAASFDSTPTRGTQQPFQLYNSANAIELSFSLKWHIDEVRTFAKGDGTAYSLQEIADIAEDFTRPWEFGSSITPKLIKVILPGISEIGYITSANITYNGDMTGDYETGSGVVDARYNSSNSIAGAHGFTTNYHFTQLEISFTLLVVKDIKLLSQSQSPGKEWKISSTNSYGPDYSNSSRSSNNSNANNNGSTEDETITEAEEEEEVVAVTEETPCPYEDAELQQTLTPKAKLIKDVKKIGDLAVSWAKTQIENVKYATSPDGASDNASDNSSQNYSPYPQEPNQSTEPNQSMQP
jgi:hypothetical protein